MSLSRISATIPEDVLAAADRKAEELDRSRSWVIAEALRQYVAAGGARAVREPAVTYRPGLGSSRQAQLEADLALTPEERVRAAEQVLALDAARGRARQQDRLITFDTYDDYLAWDKQDRIRP